MPRRKWLVLTALSLFLMVTIVACRNQAPLAAVVAPQTSVLTDLESTEQLRATFNDDTGKPRLLMILAPL